MSFFDKFIGIMGFKEEEDPEEEYFEDEQEEYGDYRKDSREAGYARDNTLKVPQFQQDSAARIRRQPAPVVSIHTQKQVRVVVVEPRSFEESQNIAEHLKARRSVILNLEKADGALAQRMVDFISGTTYALDGNMQKVGNGIFLFVPNNVDISGELQLPSDREIRWPGNSKMQNN